MLVQTDLRTHPTAAARNIYYEAAAPITANNVQDAIEQAAALGAAITPTIVVFGQSPYTPLATDKFLAVDTTGGPVVINLTASASRNGLPLIVKDDKENADVNAITVNRNGAELIDGKTSILMDSKSIAIKFAPVTGGYDIV